MVDDESAHEYRSSREEVRAIPPRCLALIDEGEVELVDDHRRLEGRRPVLVEMRGRNYAQAVVHQRYQLIYRSRTS